MEKASKSDLWNQQYQEAQLLDKDFGTWHKNISEGSTLWKKHTKMHCNGREALKDHQHCNPVSPPLEYMKARGVYKSQKTNAYDLCDFYCVSASGDFPTFASCVMLECLLEAWPLQESP